MLPQGEPAGVAALLGVPRLLDAMRTHFGAAASPNAARPPACGGGLLPAELRALRQGLLNAALSLLLATGGPPHKASRIAADDIQVPLPACAIPYTLCIHLSLSCIVHLPNSRPCSSFLSHTTDIAPLLPGQFRELSSPPWLFFLKC